VHILKEVCVWQGLSGPSKHQDS